MEGRKLEKKGRRDRLERHIAKADSLGKVRSLGVLHHCDGGLPGDEKRNQGEERFVRLQRGGYLERRCRRLHNPARAALSLLSFSAFCQH